MTYDHSFAKGYADGRQAFLLGLDAGQGRQVSFMTPYRAGFEFGRIDSTEHAARARAFAGSTPRRHCGILVTADGGAYAGCTADPR